MAGKPAPEADFLGLQERTVRRLFREQKLPAKKYQAGRWVMVDVDYYLNLRGATHGTREPETISGEVDWQ